ncbi:MAG: hypothetical protein ABGW66_05935 [Flavobacteriaceae bacterium]
MIQSNLLIGSKKGKSPEDVFLSTKHILKMLEVNIDVSQYIKLFNDVMSFNEGDIEELSFQLSNK